MKHFISALIVFLCVSLAIPTYALEGNSNVSIMATTTNKVRIEMKAKVESRQASSTERKEEMQEKRDNMKASSTERREELKDRLIERKASSTERRIEMQQDLAKRKAAYVYKLITATINRLHQIITRLESRIDKVWQNGGNVSASQSFVALAKTDLANASSSVKLLLTLDLSGDKAQENFEKVREAAKIAKDHIRKAHDNLKKAIRALIGQTGQKNATTTTNVQATTTIITN
jgi:hypothetical protein